MVRIDRMRSLTFPGRDSGRIEVVLQTFGKLPICTDFSLTVGDDEAAGWLIDWVKHGRESYSSLMNPPGMRFRYLLVPPKSSDALVGIIMDSYDRARRRYPFTVYAVIPQSRILSASPAVAHWLWPVWETLTGVLERLCVATDAADVHQFCRESALLLPESATDEEREAFTASYLSTETAPWLACVLGAQARLNIGPFVIRARNCLAGAADRPVAIHVPMGKDLPVPAQIDFWIDTVVAAGGDGEGVPTLFFSSGDVPREPACSILFRPTEFIDYQLLGGNVSESQFVENLGTVNGTAVQREPDAREWLEKHRDLASVRDALSSL